MILVFRLENNVAPNNVSNTLMIFINAITDDQFNLFTIKMGQMDFDISIVGCGPVGATLANLLSDFGYSVAIFEISRENF